MLGGRNVSGEARCEPYMFTPSARLGAPTAMGARDRNKPARENAILRTQAGMLFRFNKIILASGLYIPELVRVGRTGLRTAMEAEE